MAHSVSDASWGVGSLRVRAGQAGCDGEGPEGEPSKPIEVTKVTVLPDRLEVTVRVKDESCRYVSRSLVAACLRDFPELPFHACKNDKGPLFGDVLDQASLPHLLEHLVITLQVRSDQSRGASSFSYLGSTQWLPVGGSAQVNSSCLAKMSVRFRNDLVALTCLKDALGFMNEHF